MTVTNERSTERRGLGRGLGELFQRTDLPPEPRAEAQPAPTAAEPLVPVPAGSSYAELPLEQIVPNPRQPRSVFDGDALEELVDSIREVGLLQPVVVRETAPDRYELVMGERRWRASQEAGTGTIPAIVHWGPDLGHADADTLDSLAIAARPQRVSGGLDETPRLRTITMKQQAERTRRKRPLMIRMPR